MLPVDSVVLNLIPVETPEVDVSFITSEVSTQSEATRHCSGSHNVSAVHYKPSDGLEMQISCHTAILKDDSTLYTHVGSHEVQISKKYSE